MFRLRSRRVVSVVFTVSMLAEGSTFTSRASAQTVAEGDKAARAKDWAKALSAYEAANRAQPSAEALEGVANAHLQLQHDGEAFAAFTEWLDKYGAKAPKAKRTAVEARLKELTARTGTLAIEVNDAGAEISIDDRVVGASPLRAPVRLSAGPHRVHVAKEGFAPVDLAPNVIAGANATTTVKLEAQSTKGRLVVREKSGKALRVIVDGVDMGDAPWSGELEAGTHDVAGRSSLLGAFAQKVNLERGKEAVVELIASSTTAPLKISTSDGRGLVFLDDKLVAEGTFTGEVPAGTHRIRVTREGYDPFEEEIVLKEREPLSRSVTLKLSSKIETGTVQEAKRPLEGLYGGFQLMGAISPGGFRSSPERLCSGGDRPAELASCSDGTNSGFGIGGFIGHHWDPVGIELFFLGQYDHQSPSLEWNASSVDLGIGPDPARTEDFSIRRFGGLGAARLRLTFQGEKLRFSGAAGVGLAARSLVLTRETKSRTDASLPADKLVSDAQGYLSFALVIEPTVQYRLTESVAAVLGASLIVDSPTSLSDIPRTAPEGNHRLGPNGLTTPSYELAAGTQVWTGLFLGMMFGP